MFILIFYRLLEVLEDFRCVKDIHFLIYTGSAENTLTLWRHVFQNIAMLSIMYMVLNLKTNWILPIRGYMGK